MSKIKMVKAIGEAVISIGVGAIVGNAISATTPSNVNRVNKVFILTGAFVLGYMISDKVTKYVEGEVDTAVENVKEIIRCKKQ